MNNSLINKISIENIKMVCLEMIDKAKSGHPGMALGSAPIVHTLFTKVLNVNPKEPKWVNRDRFILSGGHASSLLYSVLHLSGYGLSVEDLKNFRQLGSNTPGHPEIDETPGVDASTGPLGQGFAYGVGTALSEAYMNNKFPELINHYTYVLCGDGDIQEGISKEAMSIAGKLGLNKLIVLYDSNDIQLDGSVEDAYNEELKKEAEAFSWNYILIKDGTDCNAILNAIKKAKKSTKPTIIEVKTIIGAGCKNQGTSKVHGAPIPHDETLELREKLGGEAFAFPQEVYDYYKKNVYNRGKKLYKKWDALEKNEEFKKFLEGKHEVNFDLLEKYESSNLSHLVPTRKVSGTVLKEISNQDPYFIGGAADVASSTQAIINGDKFTKENRDGRNIYFGVREHAMGSIANAITMYGLKCFASSFFAFVDYMKCTIRMAALSKLPTLFVFSHDSIAVGEDGPTHQPIEQLTMCRSIPNTYVYRPCDGNEVNECYRLAYNSKTSPSVMIMSRQVLPVVSDTVEDLKDKVAKGAYIVSKEEKQIDGILIACGSEVSLALDAKELLKAKGYDIRVVSMPCNRLFDEQSIEYKESILPSNVSRKMAIEMSDAVHYYKYVGTHGKVFNIEEFGKSGNAKPVIEHYGFTKENVCEEFEKLENVQYTILF